MRTLVQGIARLFGALDRLEFALGAGLALLAVVLGPLVVAGIAGWSGRWGTALTIGVPWLVILGRAAWEIARAGRSLPVTAFLAFLWLVVTLILGCYLN
jgi:hypothetical protein